MRSEHGEYGTLIFTIVLQFVVRIEMRLTFVIWASCGCNLLQHFMLAQRIRTLEKELYYSSLPKPKLHLNLNTTESE